MGRIARKHQLTGSLAYHVWSRSNGKVRIFHEEHDFRRFMSRLRQYSAECLARIYHWCIMPNHFHIVMELPRPEELTLLMARLLGGYARYYIKRYETAGHVWQGRFKSQPIQKEIYLLRCGRYVERNPYKAGIVERPWDYEWSSCRVYALGIDDGITERNPFYNGFGTTDEERQFRYREWLMDGGDDEFKDARGFAGDQQFASNLALVGNRLMAKRNGRPMQ